MTTARPTLWDRFFAYFRLKNYLRNFAIERNLRSSAMEELAAEKQPLILEEREDIEEREDPEYYNIPSASNNKNWTPDKKVVYTPPRDSRGRFVKIR